MSIESLVFNQGWCMLKYSVLLKKVSGEPRVSCFRLFCLSLYSIWKAIHLTQQKNPTLPP